MKIMPTATNARNFTQCDSMLIGADCGAHTFPYVECRNNSAQLEHEATTSRIGEDQLFYCLQRGISEEDAISMIVNGFCKDVFSELPLEFAVEAQNSSPSVLNTASVKGKHMLRIKDLQVSVEDKAILRGLNFDVKPGEVHAIMGPNGSGKSTLSATLAGREDYEVTHGSVEFNGKDLLEMSPEDRAGEGIFMAFQYPVEIPGVSNQFFLQTALNAVRKYRGLEAWIASTSGI